MTLTHWALNAIVSFTLACPWAQTPGSDLQPGTPLTGEIVDDDPEVVTDTLIELDLEETARGKTYTLLVAESGAYHIDLHSHFFDAYLVLKSETGEVLAEDDDGLLRTHARIDRQLEPGRRRSRGSSSIRSSSRPGTTGSRGPSSEPTTTSGCGRPRSF